MKTLNDYVIGIAIIFALVELMVIALFSFDMVGKVWLVYPIGFAWGSIISLTILNLFLHFLEES